MLGVQIGKVAGQPVEKGGNRELPPQSSYT